MLNFLAIVQKLYCTNLKKELHKSEEDLCSSLKKDCLPTLKKRLYNMFFRYNLKIILKIKCYKFFSETMVSGSLKLSFNQLTAFLLIIRVA